MKKMSEKKEEVPKKGNKPKDRQKYNLKKVNITKENCCFEVYMELKEVQATVRAINRDVGKIKKFLEKQNGGAPL